MPTHLKPFFSSTSEDCFFGALKMKVRNSIGLHQRTAVRTTILKTICYPAVYLCFYLLLLRNGRQLIWLYGCYAAMGLLVTLIVFNIVHDAVHGALFSSRTANRRAARLMDFLGANSFVWRNRHVIYHHSYTNIPGWDIDIRQTKLVKFNPAQAPRKAYQFQQFYMPFLYLLYSLNWVLVRDFQDFFKPDSLIRSRVKIPVSEYFRLLIFKTFYFISLLLIPYLLTEQPFLHIFLGFVFMHACTSALTLLVLLPSHLDEHALFPEPDDDLKMKDSWAVHQLKFTNDFGTNQPLLNFIMGGLNHHIAHHLFPTLNHNLIPYVTPHIQQAAADAELPYKCYNFGEIMVSHFRLLRNNGAMKHFMEQ